LIKSQTEVKKTGYGAVLDKAGSSVAWQRGVALAGCLLSSLC